MKKWEKDCSECAAREGCEYYSEGTFCPEFRSYEPDPNRKDPQKDGWEPD